MYHNLLLNVAISGLFFFIFLFADMIDEADIYYIHKKKNATSNICV